MKQLIATGIVLMTLGAAPEHKESHMNSHNHQQPQHSDHGGHGGHHAQAEAQLMVAIDPTNPTAGQPVTLRLMIHAADGTMMRDFDVVHEEKVHLVIVREGLEQFAHVHPTVDAEGNLTIRHTFPAGGTYRLFADYTPTGGKHATATGVVQIAGDSPAAPALVPNAPGNIEADGLHAAVSAAPLKAGTPAHVAFTLKNDDGEPAKLEPYMGELGHLMFVGVGSWRYVHVHPAGGDASRGTVEFEAHFPESGLYKGWGQFKQDGRVRVVPLVLKVE